MNTSDWSAAHIEVNGRVQAQGIAHALRGPGQHVVEDMVGAFLSKLRADTRLLQQVV